MAGGHGSAPAATGGDNDASPDPQVGPPDRSRLSACYARTLRFAPLALILDCGAPVMVTLN